MRHAAHRALWVGVLGPPFAFVLALSLGYLFVPWSCARDTKVLLHLIHMSFFAAAILSGIAGWRARPAHAIRGTEHDTVESRDTLFGIVSAGSGALFAFLILGQWLATAIIGVCQ